MCVDRNLWSAYIFNYFVLIVLICRNTLWKALKQYKKQYQTFHLPRKRHVPSFYMLTLTYVFGSFRVKNIVSLVLSCWCRPKCQLRLELILKQKQYHTIGHLIAEVVVVFPDSVQVFHGLIGFTIDLCFVPSLYCFCFRTLSFSLLLGYFVVLNLFLGLCLCFRHTVLLYY